MSKMIKYFTHTPDIKSEMDRIIIHADQSKFRQTNQELREIIPLSSSDKQEEARQLLKPLIKSGTHNSEIYRIYGQILVEEGNYEEALIQLIDALRLNPQDGNAILMPGNISARYFRDKSTALVGEGRGLKVRKGQVFRDASYG